MKGKIIEIALCYVYTPIWGKYLARIKIKLGEQEHYSGDQTKKNPITHLHARMEVERLRA
jgi:hypothetical protein